jgi:hypothetical protein
VVAYNVVIWYHHSDSYTEIIKITDIILGVYAVLFGVCVFIMRHKRATVKKIHQVAIIILFCLATLAFIFGGFESSTLAQQYISGFTHGPSLTLYFVAK